MNLETKRKMTKLTPKSIVIISLITLSLLLLAVAGQITYSVLKNEKIYNGVQINNIEAGNLSVDELKQELKKNYQDKVDNQELILKAKGIVQTVKFPELNVKYDMEAAVDEAYSVGRKGNIFQRLSEIIRGSRKGYTIDMPVSYDKDKIEALAKTLYEQTLISVKEADVTIQETQMTIRSGHHGENIDKNYVTEEVEKSLKICKGTQIDIPIIIKQPTVLDTEGYFAQINIEAENAKASIEKNNLTVVPHVIGRRIDKEKLLEVAADMQKNEDTEFLVPITYITPKITTEIFNARLFKDELSTMQTQFSTDTTNNANRAENIKLASTKINGKLLAPGEIFSFNGVVGERTAKAGYKVAHTYVGGEILDGIGGGICQVSTTLYNAVLLSDLKVLERKNHQFTVGYVPYGRDASVSYGSVDFKFENSTAWPIKIESSVTPNNRLAFKIIGTNEYPGRTIEFDSKIVRTIDYKVKYVDDPTLEEGKTKVVHTGMKGYVVDTFEIIKQDGKVVSQKKLHTSYYNAYDSEVKRGTKKGKPVATVTPASPAQPTPKSTPLPSGTPVSQTTSTPVPPTQQATSTPKPTPQITPAPTAKPTDPADTGEETYIGA